MTDREPTAPADSPPVGRARTAPPGGPNPIAHQDPAPRGDGSPMSLTLAPRTRPAADTSADAVRAWLARLPGADPSAFAPAVLPAADRTPVEADAVSRAAACPDLFVVHAADHHAGERVIADLAGCAVGRTLVLSPNPAAADRIVERLARSAVVRALADDENPVRPSTVVSRLTSAALGTGRVEQARRDAASAVAAADARLTALEKFGELSDRLAKFDAEAADLTARREAIENAVRVEAAGRGGTPFDAVTDRLKERREGAVRPILEQRRVTEEAHGRKTTALAELRRQHAETAAGAGKKSGFFARLLGRAKHAPDPAELERQIRASEQELRELDARGAALQTELEAATASAAAEYEKAIQEEVAARRVELDTRLAELTAERQRLLAGVGVANPPPPHELPAAQREAARELVAAKEHAAELNRPADEVVRRLLAGPRVVVGTPGSLDADPVFRREPADPHAAESAPPFALLVLDRSEELTEHDFVRLARLAARWVLVGDVPPADEPRPHLNGAHHRHPPGRNGRPVEVPFASRLARHLDRRTWAVEADRLVCRLAPLPADARRDLTREPLLDRADIELRFAQGGDGEPVVAEVAFPAATPVPAAKSFVFEQLDKILLRPCGPVEWDHTPNAVTARWPAADHGSGPDATWIDLEPGVREKVVGSGACAFTAAVSFDPAAGWDADKVAAWLDRHLPAHSACRFAAVPRAGHPPRA